MERWMEPLASALLTVWRRNGSYGLRLGEAVPDDQFLGQPIAGRAMNHPAWIFAHLNLYADIAGRLAAGEAFPDPMGHAFGPRSVVSARAGDYPPPAALLTEFARLHESTAESVATTDAARLAASNPLERWRGMAPTVGDMLATLLAKHESHHLGQLSAWRRAMGLPPVAM